MVSVLACPKNEVFDKLGARSVKISTGLINLLVILGIQAYSCKGDVLLIALFLDFDRITFDLLFVIPSRKQTGRAIQLSIEGKVK